MSFVKPRYWERKKEGKGRVREKADRYGIQTQSNEGKRKIKSNKLDQLSIV